MKNSHDFIEIDEYKDHHSEHLYDVDLINSQNEKIKNHRFEVTYDVDYEYYTKLLKKKLIEKTLTMERIIKKWDKDYGNFT